ncbi:MAG: hypothetical protein IPP71_09480 [Bacteroidetes bacterium]|nr:hypothetical protein [Bacteroidota bacterium]
MLHVISAFQPEVKDENVTCLFRQTPLFNFQEQPTLYLESDYGFLTSPDNFSENINLPNFKQAASLENSDFHLKFIVRDLQLTDFELKSRSFTDKGILYKYYYYYFNVVGEFGYRLFESNGDSLLNENIIREFAMYSDEFDSERELENYVKRSLKNDAMRIAGKRVRNIIENDLDWKTYRFSVDLCYVKESGVAYEELKRAHFDLYNGLTKTFAEDQTTWKDDIDSAIVVFLKYLDMADLSQKKSNINSDVTECLLKNTAIAYLFSGREEKAAELISDYQKRVNGIDVTTTKLKLLKGDPYYGKCSSPYVVFGSQFNTVKLDDICKEQTQRKIKANNLNYK